MRVLAALSGGVDSAVAAARARDAGHEVTAVHLALGADGVTSGCCSAADARDARRAADVLGLPYYVWDLADRFAAEVIDDFVAEYAAGRTPNPCVRCNERIKFAAVAERAVALGFDAVVTGHYARLVDGVLHRAVDVGKDQSYVLATLTARQLSHALFPIGPSTKAQVRAEAAARGLAVADKPDSTDVCFVAGGTRDFLRQRLPSAPGPVVDAGTGEVVGHHDGAEGFTIGQRRGLRLSTPAADGRPRYVLAVSPVDRTVTVGPAEALDVVAFEAHRPVWTGGPPPVRATTCQAQVRAHGAPLPASVRWLDGADGPRLSVRLEAPVRGLAAGQTVALYDGDRVLGGATVSATAPAAGTHVAVTPVASTAVAGAHVAGTPAPAP